MGQSRPLFVYFRHFLDTISIIQIEKSIDGVLGIQTWGRRMVGADNTTELWRPPKWVFITLHITKQRFFITNTDFILLQMKLCMYLRDRGLFLHYYNYLVVICRVSSIMWNSTGKIGPSLTIHYFRILKCLWNMSLHAVGWGECLGGRLWEETHVPKVVGYGWTFFHFNLL